MQDNSIKQIENKNNIINPSTQNTNIDISNTNNNTININTISNNYNFDSYLENIGTLWKLDITDKDIKEQKNEHEKLKLFKNKTDELIENIIELIQYNFSIENLEIYDKYAISKLFKKEHIFFEKYFETKEKLEYDFFSYIQLKCINLFIKTYKDHFDLYKKFSGKKFRFNYICKEEILKYNYEDKDQKIPLRYGYVLSYEISDIRLYLVNYDIINRNKEYKEKLYEIYKHGDLSIKFLNLTGNNIHKSIISKIYKERKNLFQKNTESNNSDYEFIMTLLENLIHSVFHECIHLEDYIFNDISQCYIILYEYKLLNNNLSYISKFYNVFNFYNIEHLINNLINKQTNDDQFLDIFRSFFNNEEEKKKKLINNFWFYNLPYLLINKEFNNSISLYSLKNMGEFFPEIFSLYILGFFNEFLQYLLEFKNTYYYRIYDLSKNLITNGELKVENIFNKIQGKKMIELTLNKKIKENEKDKIKNPYKKLHNYIIEEDINNSKIIISGFPIIYKSIFNPSSEYNIKMINVSKQKLHLLTDLQDITAETIILNYAIIDCNNILSIFKNCHNLKKIELVNTVFLNINDTSEMFYNCKNLTEIVGLETITINNEIHKANEMFWQCVKLKEINLTKFHFNKKCILDGLFHSCINLKTIKFNETISKEQVFLYEKERNILTISSKLFFCCKAPCNIYLNKDLYSLDTVKKSYFKLNESHK